MNLYRCDERLYLYRGLPDHVWESRLVLCGWPEEAARKMAAFLVGKEQTPPKWMEMME